MKQLVAGIFAVALLLPAQPLFAQEERRDLDARVEGEVRVEATAQPVRPEAALDIREKALELRAEAERRAEALLQQTTRVDARADAPVTTQRGAEVRAEAVISPEERRLRLEAAAEERERTLRAQAEVRKAEAEARQMERRTELTERAKVRIETYTTQMVRRLEAMATRLDTLSARISIRISLLAEAGADVSAARESLLRADEAIARARVAIRALVDGSARLVASLSAEGDIAPNVVFAEVREYAHAAGEALRAAHRALMDTVEFIKGLNITVE